MRPLPVVRDTESPSIGPSFDPGGHGAPRSAEHGIRPAAFDLGTVASTEGVVFRDPPPVEETARRLELSIARTLVGAPSLPTELKAFRLALLGLKVDRRGIDLVIGPTDPVAQLRMSRERDEAGVRVVVEELHPDASRWARPLSIMAERLRAATTPDKWEQAWAMAKELSKLPNGVPLGFLRQLVAGVEPREGLIRVGFGCNQDCGMCWQGREWGRYGADQVIRWIEDLRAAGARGLIISGGEPTLDADIFRYIERAREIGFTAVTLETNAVQMAKEGYAARLRAAGVTSCFVSLHSGDAAISDAITRAPGTHARTVKGTLALLDAGVQVVLNAVTTAEGLEHLGALPDFVHATFGRRPELGGLMISYPSVPFDTSLMPSIVPDPTRLRVMLRQAIDRAIELGIRLSGLDGPCGPPLCAFGADPRVTAANPVPGPVEFRLHAPACDGCAVKHACFGVRHADIERFGDACVTPIAARP